MTRKHYIIVLSATIMLIAFFSCTKDKGKVPAPVAPTYDCSTVHFSQDIKPLIDSKCIACHSASYLCGDLITYDDVKIKVDNGTLMQKVVRDKTMPPGNPLTEEELQQFKCWLENGGNNN